MITIGSVGLLPICVKYSYPRNACLPFYYSSRSYSPNGNSHLDHNASIDADFRKEMPFWGVKISKKDVRVIFAAENWKNFLTVSKA
jgi:hypothetical protein